MKLVDSDILIAHLHGVTAARDWLEAARLLAAMRRVPLSEPVAWRAAEFMRTYRRSHQGIGLGDYLIAGTADVEGLELTTLNVRHFPMFQSLRRPFELRGLQVEHHHGRVGQAENRSVRYPHQDLRAEQLRRLGWRDAGDAVSHRRGRSGPGSRLRAH